MTAMWKLRNYAAWKKHWDSTRKYKGSVNTGNNVRMRPDGEAFVFFPNAYNDVILGCITPDDIFTVMLPTDACRTWYFKYSHILGVTVYSHKKTRTQVNTLKCREQNMSWRNAYPFVNRLQFKIGPSQATCINRELAVQLVRRVKPEVQRQVTEVLAPLSAACRVIGRLNGYELKEPHGWWQRAAMVNTKLEGLSLEQVNSETVTPQDVLELGAASTSGVWSFNWQNENRQKGFIQRAVDNGLRLVREHFYRRLDGYVIVTASDSLTED
jgi:hypothetical protein